jgi:hypothetical protein
VPVFWSKLSDKGSDSHKDRPHNMAWIYFPILKVLSHIIVHSSESRLVVKAEDRGNKGTANTGEIEHPPPTLDLKTATGADPRSKAETAAPPDLANKSGVPVAPQGADDVMHLRAATFQLPAGS